MNTKQKYVFLSAILILIPTLYLTCGFIQKYKSVTQASETVTSYLKYSSNLEWNEAQDLLTGEALNNAIRNQDTVMEKEEILNINFSSSTTNGDLATTVAEVEKTGAYDDLNIYRLHLTKKANKWLIYKVEYKDFARPKINPKKEHSAAREVLSEYLSLKAEQRSENAEKYLAGNLLRSVLKNRSLQQNNQPVGLEEKLVSIETVGATKKAATYTAIMEISLNGSVLNSTSLLVDLVEVNNGWKIANIDIIEVK